MNIVFITQKQTWTQKHWAIVQEGFFNGEKNIINRSKNNWPNSDYKKSVEISKVWPKPQNNEDQLFITRIIESAVYMMK